MNRDEAAKLIEKKALEILKANGYDDDGLCGRIGDGCEIEGEPLWVFWPLDDGSVCVAVYANTVMYEDREVSWADGGADDGIIALDDLTPGYREIQVWIAEIESQIA